MIKAIIFDADGVYLKGTFDSFIRDAAEILGLDGIPHPDKKGAVCDGMHLGRTDVISACEKLFDKKPSHKQKEHLLEAFDHHFEPEPKMRQLALKLKGSYLIALLANSEPRSEHIAEEKGWYDIFDAVAYSHREGLMKPDPRFYLHIANVLDVNPRECLLIDDNPAYVEGAQKVEMQAILFTSYFDLLNKLREMDIRF